MAYRRHRRYRPDLRRDHPAPTAVATHRFRCPCAIAAAPGIRLDSWYGEPCIGEGGRPGSMGGSAMSEMRVIGIRVEQPQNQPVLLLREASGERYLPIWIGQAEATAIVLEQEGVTPVRPLTHDLIKVMISDLGHTLEEVHIVDLKEGTFYADLVFENEVRISARPSDSVAIALRVGCPIYAAESVLEEAGLVMPDEREDEVEKFKEFLESVSPDDFKATDS